MGWALLPPEPHLPSMQVAPGERRRSVPSAEEVPVPSLPQLSHSLSGGGSHAPVGHGSVVDPPLPEELLELELLELDEENELDEDELDEEEIPEDELDVDEELGAEELLVLDEEELL